MKGYRKSLSNASGLDDLGKFLLVSFFFVGCKNITERQTCHGKCKSVGVANTIYLVNCKLGKVDASHLETLHLQLIKDLPREQGCLPNLGNFTLQSFSLWVLVALSLCHLEELAGLLLQLGAQKFHQGRVAVLVANCDVWM